MGKSGDLLRAQKAQKTIWTFNREQMVAHDQSVRQDYRERCIAELNKEHAKLEAELQQKVADANRKIAEANKHLEETRQDFQMEMLNLLLCVSCRVLIEQFGFPSVKQEKPHPANRTYRFANALVETMNRFGEDDEDSFIKYCDETIELYGVGFRRSVDGEEGEQEN